MAEGRTTNKGRIVELGSQGMSQTEAMLHTCKTMAGQHIPEANVISRKESRREVSGMDLNTDLLAEVFSHLSYKDLFEVMLVSKHREKTVT